MKTDNRSAQSYDHLPSAEELAQMYMQSEQNDPRSVFYKRTLVRPKLKVWRILLFVLLTAGACALAYIGVHALCGNVFLAILGSFVALALICLVFAKQVLIGMVKIYQAIAPAGLRNRCRYEPSCSAYMILAIEKHGFWRGLRMGLTRWKGCKPPNGGYDLP